MTDRKPHPALPARPWRLLAAAALSLVAAATYATGDGCPPIDGVDAVLGEGRVLLLGEIHGTAESPAFVDAVACHAIGRGLAVTVALELPQADEPAVGRFLGSSGADADRAEILALPFWAKPYQDGRSSEAMLRLLDQLRTRKHAGGDLRVVLLDRPEEPDRRDEAMASRLLAAAGEAPTGMLIALTGNLHNRTAAGSGRMGERVRSALGAARVTSLDLSYSGGTGWICQPDGSCGAVGLRGHGAGEGLRLALDAAADAPYQGTYYVGAITASPPAQR